MNWLRIHVADLSGVVMSKNVFNLSVKHFLNVMHAHSQTEALISLYISEANGSIKIIKEGLQRYKNGADSVKLKWIIDVHAKILAEEDITFFKEHDVEIHLNIAMVEEARAALKSIKKLKASVQINTSVMPSNFFNLRGIVDIAEEYNVDRIYLDQFVGVEAVSLEERVQKYRDVYFYALVKKIQIIGPWSPVISNFQKFIKRNHHLEEEIVIDVNTDGTFYSHVLGDSRKIPRDIEDLVSFFNQNGRDKFVQEAIRFYDEKCQGCSIMDHCYGKAIQHAQDSKGEETDVSFSCNFFREWCGFLLRPVYFKRADKVDVISMIGLEKIQPMIDTISEAIIHLENRLWPLKKRILVNVLEYPEELKGASNQFNLPDWVRATTNGDNVFYQRGTIVTPALVHELTHLFIAQRQLKLPAWFIEGLCEWTQNHDLDSELLKKSVNEKNLFKALQKIENEKMSLIDLDQNIPFENPYYLQAKAFVGYLHSKLGQQEFDLLLNSCESCQLEDVLRSQGTELSKYISDFCEIYS